MTFKLVSKNNLGVVLLLLLVVFISQSRIFNFLIDTALGRAVIILLLIGISYTNKILGVVGVLLIIIMFNNSSLSQGFGYLEGFETPTTTPTTPTTTTTTTTPTTTPTTSSDTTPKKTNMPTDNSAIVSTPTPAPISTEGYDILATENNIKRGKESNTIPVDKSLNSSEDVLPHEGKGSFKENFSSFSLF